MHTVLFVAGREVTVGAAVRHAFVILAVLALVPDYARAFDGELRLSPAKARAGQRIKVVYWPEASLRTAERLILRARYRTIHDNVYSEPPYTEGTLVVSAAVLERQRDGTFAGWWSFPDSVVFASLAVETPDATVVDSNSGRYWEMLAHARNGKPLLVALEQRIADLQGRDWVEAMHTARRMTELYPQHALPWLRLLFFEELLAATDELDSIDGRYRRKFRDLARRHLDDATWRRQSLPYLASFAYRYEGSGAAGDDSAAFADWVTRAVRELPTAPEVLWIRSSRIYRAGRTDPAAALRAYDALWAEGGDSLFVSTTGLQPRHQFTRGAHRTAIAAQDSAAIVLWGERAAAGGRYARRSTGRFLLQNAPIIRPVVMDWIRSELRVVNQRRPEHRFLGETIMEQERRHAQEARELMGLLGRALVAGGDMGAAVDTLAMAAADGWDLEVFQDVADARLAAHDTLGALEVLAMMSVDPRTSAATRDSAALLASRFAGGKQRWLDLVGGAPGEMARRVLAGAINEAPRRSVRLRDQQGRSHSLEEMTSGKITFVLYWSKDCGDARRELALADSVAMRLARSGVRVVSVSSTAPSPAVNALIQEKQLQLPVYYDAYSDVQSAFDAWASPTYVVLDASGRVRFRSTSSPDRALVQVEALRHEHVP